MQWLSDFIVYFYWKHNKRSLCYHCVYTLFSEMYVGQIRLKHTYAKNSEIMRPCRWEFHLRKDSLHVKRPVVDIGKNACAFRFPPPPSAIIPPCGFTRAATGLGNCIPKLHFECCNCWNSRAIRGLSIGAIQF